MAPNSLRLYAADCFFLLILLIFHIYSHHTENLFHSHTIYSHHTEYLLPAFDIVTILKSDAPAWFESEGFS